MVWLFFILELIALFLLVYIIYTALSLLPAIVTLLLVISPIIRLKKKLSEVQYHRAFISAKGKSNILSTS
jgi:hypothetical protein